MDELDTKDVERHAWTLAAVVTVSVVTSIWLSTTERVPEYLLLPVSDAFLDATPHLNAALVSVALLTLAGGYRAIKDRRVQRHAKMMAVTAALFFSFVGLYVLRLAHEGLTEFQGPESIYLYIYLPVLFVHMTLAAVAVPLVVYCLYVGVRLPEDRVIETGHPKVGRLAAPLWGVSFVLGVVVYLLLHHLY